MRQFLQAKHSICLSVTSLLIKEKKICYCVMPQSGEVREAEYSNQNHMRPGHPLHKTASEQNQLNRKIKPGHPWTMVFCEAAVSSIYGPW